MNKDHRTGEAVITEDLQGDLSAVLNRFPADKIFAVFEANTYRHCYPLMAGYFPVPASRTLVLEPGEEQKDIRQVMRIWEAFGEAGIDRGSLIVNVGGGMLTDLGGFAASTLKRGVRFVNIPTTLLAMVDASVGGKTGVNFRGLKNEIGVIRQPERVFLYIPFLRTLDRENLLSGYAEMLKAGLIADRDLWNRLKDFDPGSRNEDALRELIFRSVEIKREIVEADPEERGIRKALNFGHTIGHALESECLHSGNPLAHGYAVAYGMIVEAELSHRLLGLPVESVEEIRSAVIRLYGLPPERIRDIDTLIHWMRFDKKNRNNKINFTLLEQIGKCRTNVEVEEDDPRLRWSPPARG